jgi:nicotinic acid phosphoribosyltransferase
MSMPDMFADYRQQLRAEFFGKLFQLGGFLGATDTYKRTMWSAVPDIARQPATYTLVMRRGLPEPGANNRLIMAGHETMLAQWFFQPLKRSTIELACEWFSHHASVRAFPKAAWEAVLQAHSGDDIYLPVDIYGFPGGQTFLPTVPCLVFEGPGAIVSYLEPAMCRYFAPILHATKARLMRQVTASDAEFGLRSAPNEISHVALLLARYVGGSNGQPQLTSNDTAEFLFPELFKSIGTIGHEMMCAGQTFEKPLAQAEYEMMDRFVATHGHAALLCDLVDAESVGLENAIRVMKAYPTNTHVGIRVDSGDIAAQCVLYYRAMKAAGLGTRTIVFEDEVTPDTIRHVYDHFRAETGEEPTMLFPGAGGYWWRLVHRDTVAAAFKRSATDNRPNVKFSNSPGKESLGGRLRVFGDGDTMIVANVDETPPGQPLMVKLVDQGRVVYREPYRDQALRAAATWNLFKRVVLSPGVRTTMERFQAMRASEVAQAKMRMKSLKVKSDVKAN